MNTFLNTMKMNDNYTFTENGAITHKSTLSKVLDMFALGGAYRERTDAECIRLFQKAFEENPDLAMKCLFYHRDIRGGSGERRFFRVIFHWLCKAYPATALKNLINISEYGRWDDLIYATVDTPLQKEAFKIIKHQLALDVQSKTPSLLAKWLPSTNASSAETKRVGNLICKYLNIKQRGYRRVLSALRDRIRIVEKLMSENRWNEIEFDKIPSKAGLIYKNAFARRDIIAQKYEQFIKNKNTKVNAAALYPYDIAHKCFAEWDCNNEIDDVERVALQKYWDNLPNYYGDRKENGLAIVDVSGSMKGRPMEAAISLGAYIAEKAHGPFANHFITFSMTPQLVEFTGYDICEKIYNCINANWGFNTNLSAVFDMLLQTALNEKTKPEDMPTRLYIFSDMEFDRGLCFQGDSFFPNERYINTQLENIQKLWESKGYKLPQVIFWNLDARNDNIPAIGEGFSYVSGLSPIMIQTILSGKDGYDLMLEKLLSKRYEAITA